ncbi:proteasome subunit beta type-3, putative [Entamoeba invadens IP1]|uniref:Proteasome subunit beta n=1 Tax=Entamoeba invadens IP1 TaxID=370355 RepID=A0A0A1TVB4_ENTIV|nr:proteasome subunit beta type-3, putative [Entamoeba invadens IP1]ELP84297.1 proteasome subunit beta type-3, putative [Entamoeba invadens IP1]|eukprot:XP_004183643.1 proteasome subunit beta type-3, putative [Entamoeba invadens IP1]
MGDSIDNYSGGIAIGMCGKNCVALAADNRYGLRYQFASSNFHKVFQLNEHCLVGGCGVYADVQTVFEQIKYDANLYKLREGRPIGPSQLVNATAHLLFSKRFNPYYMSPIIIGFDDNGKTYCSSYDYIGAPGDYRFAAVGTGCNEAMGVCDSFYKEDMEPEELVETIGQCLLAGENRDAFSGWGVELPINLLENAQGKTIVLELKNGNKYTGTLEKCDRMMNLHVKDSVLIQPDGKKFKVAKIIVKGMAVRCFAVDGELLKKSDK